MKSRVAFIGIMWNQEQVLQSCDVMQFIIHTDKLFCNPTLPITRLQSYSYLQVDLLVDEVILEGSLFQMIA